MAATADVMREWKTSKELAEIVRKIYEPYQEPKKRAFAKEIWSKRHIAANAKESWGQVFERLYGEKLEDYAKRARKA